MPKFGAILFVLGLALLTFSALSPAVREAAAFDGQRQGFILGGALGAGLTSFTQTLDLQGIGGGKATSERQSKGGPSSDFRIGYAPDSLTELYYFNTISWFSMRNALGSDVTIASGVGGLGARRYFGPAGAAPFVTAGIGIAMWDTPLESGSSKAWSGLGGMGGAGYEFSRHWAIEVLGTWGKPKRSESGVSASANTLSFAAHLTGVAY